VELRVDLSASASGNNTGTYKGLIIPCHRFFSIHLNSEAKIPDFAYRLARVIALARRTWESCGRRKGGLLPGSQKAEPIRFQNLHTPAINLRNDSAVGGGDSAR
jgi:hypothetical protein